MSIIEGSSGPKIQQSTNSIDEADSAKQDENSSKENFERILDKAASVVHQRLRELMRMELDN